MKWLRSGVISLILLAISLGAYAQGPYDNQNSYWPMTVGNKWVMQNPFTKSVTVLTIQPPLAQYGCAPDVVPPATQNALSPWEIDETKLDPYNYWGQGTPFDLRWFLGVQPAGQSPANYVGSLYGFGWNTFDYSFGLPSGLTFQSGYNVSWDPGGPDVVSTVAGQPAYELLRAGGATGTFLGYQDQVTTYQINNGGGDPTPTPCVKDTGEMPAGNADSYVWQVVWKTTTVSVPYYNNEPVTVLEAEYWENACTGQGNVGCIPLGPTPVETWYFVNNLGPVRIDRYGPQPWLGPEALQLVSFIPGSGTVVSPLVTLRDGLLAQASSTAELTYAQWGIYFTQLTNLTAPTFTQACVNPLVVSVPITVDAYLADLESVGTSSCNVVQYPTTPKGLSANTMIQDMETSAGTTELDYDQWGYYYTQLEGVTYPAPQSNCVKSMWASDWWRTQETGIPPTSNPTTYQMAPNRFMLLDGRQWLLFYESKIFGCEGDTYDGGRKADYAVWRPSDATWYLDTASPITQPLGVSSDVPVPADYDGDGKTDLAVWEPSNGTFTVILSSTGATITQQLGLAGDIPVPGHYDNDGKADFAVWRPSTGAWYFIPNNIPGGAPIENVFGVDGDIPIVGDFDGDGKTDFAIWRPSTGVWWIVPSANPGAWIEHQFGLTGDIPVSGDFDGDGKTDLAVWRPSDGTWYVTLSSTGATVTQQWGLPGDVPVPADFDGDGKTDFAVWRPSNGTWYVIPSSNPGSPITKQWGLDGDTPAP